MNQALPETISPTLPTPAPAPAPRSAEAAPPISPERPLPTPALDATQDSTGSGPSDIGESAKRRNFVQYEDIYVTRSAGELIFLHVQNDRTLDATIGTFHTRPQTTEWILQALEEVARMSRARSTVRVHTTETELVNVIRGPLRQAPGQDDPYANFKRQLKRFGREIIIARPERESPLWRETMLLLKSGKLPLPAPFVTYSVYTAAFTTYDATYCGVVMVGLGSIIVHAQQASGDDLVTAELDMMDWVITNAGGGGRIDVYHSTDGARRIWEQAATLSGFEGPDQLGHQGSKLRALARTAFAQRTTISPARAPVGMFDQFAKSAAASKFIGLGLA